MRSPLQISDEKSLPVSEKIVRRRSSAIGTEASACRDQYTFF